MKILDNLRERVSTFLDIPIGDDGFADKRHDLQVAIDAVMQFNQRRPHVVCLYGSTRFYELFAEYALKFTMEGKIVLSIGTHAPDSMMLAHPSTDEDKRQKEGLDGLRKHKIDISDSIFVLNKDGYIGDSTRGEIQHAITKGIQIEWLEPNNPLAPLATPIPEV